MQAYVPANVVRNVVRQLNFLPPLLYQNRSDGSHHLPGPMPVHQPLYDHVQPAFLKMQLCIHGVTYTGTPKAPGSSSR